MVAQTTRYEFPLTKRARLVLKLFNLFDEIDQLRLYDNLNAFRRLLVCLVDILLLIERLEIKMELAKEAEKFIVHNGSDHSCAELKDRIDELVATPGKIGEELRNHQMFGLLQKRLLLPGGASSFDMPLLHSWLSMEHSARLEQFAAFSSSLLTLHRAVICLVDVYRRNLFFRKVEVKNGLTHLNPQPTSSIIALDVHSLAYHLVPEVSLSPKAIFIKFWKHDSVLRKAESFDGQFMLALGEC